MSVLGCLQDSAAEALVRESERVSIDRSISYLQQCLDRHFGRNVTRHFRFGSSTRGTNLPRALDEFSDIDYMIVFADQDKAPQTYLDRLRVFVEAHYVRSEIRQSHPTIGLELRHIKFDLVPAIETMWNGLQIPSGNRWQSTDPSGFNQHLTQRNSQCDNLLKPAIRLTKRWNANNAYLFDSFLLEQRIVNTWYPFCNDLRDYLFVIFDELEVDGGSQRDLERLRRAKELVRNIRAFESAGDQGRAEREVRKLI